MLFNSVTFLLFLGIVVCLYWALGRKARMPMLFLSSLVFYGFWRWDFVGLMLFSSVLDYFISLKLDNTENQNKRKALVMTSLVVNLGLLVVFKYLFFITENINSILSFFDGSGRIIPIKLILPLGISFYTFQTISYSIDVYRKHLKPEKNFFIYGTFVTFFPQLVAGPILRASEVMLQLINRPTFKISFLFEGGKRILYGMFLKVVLADNIAPLVDAGFAQSASSLSALDVGMLAFLFGFQIYFDFAGYSHIAIGCARLMGIKFPENFNFPYLASSFRSFWKRWHISLSSWIRDYLYLPILGVKVLDRNSKSQGGIETIQSQKARNPTLALFATWAIMGLWHGANWTFMLWGLYHAFFIFVERFLKKVNSLNRFRSDFVGWLIVLPIAMLSWIPFRATTLTDTFTMYGRLLQPSEYFHYSLRENNYLITVVLLIGLVLSYSLSKIKLDVTNPWMAATKIAFESIKYGIMLFLVFVFLRPISQFIYFQF